MVESWWCKTRWKLGAGMSLMSVRSVRRAVLLRTPLTNSTDLKLLTDGYDTTDGCSDSITSSSSFLDIRAPRPNWIVSRTAGSASARLFVTMAVFHDFSISSFVVSSVVSHTFLSMLHPVIPASFVPANSASRSTSMVADASSSLAPEAFWQPSSIHLPQPLRQCRPVPLRPPRSTPSVCANFCSSSCLLHNACGSSPASDEARALQKVTLQYVPSSAR